jgi:RNA polymerase sigma-70 factor (ECF subfamily)
MDVEGADMAQGAQALDVGRLVVDHHEALYRYAFRLAGSAVDAEDLTQQVFLIAQQKSDQVRDAQCARGWLFAVLRNCFLKSRRARVPLAAASVDLDIDSIPEAPREREIDGERLQAAIDALDDDFKIVILLFYFEHRTYREMAELLEIPPGTVMSRLARAKARLRHWLTEAAAGEARRRAKSEARPPLSELHGSSAGKR